ncbi:hypothetical protein BX600DRAFT_507720 [Xylariales sp. PMI_506]|nr:hypothetical protein BX600DRAFT_507720 [Xylariales sp. PMI_506]
MKNTTWLAAASDDGHFQRCWKHQNCRDCIWEEKGCSWCPLSWSCVPNPHSIALLAPAWNEEICPHWAERWEIRTRPLGCQVSTITSLTSIVSILSTIIFLLLLFVIIFLSKKTRAMWLAKGPTPRHWKFWKRTPPESTEGHEEQQPLLRPED